MIEAKSKAADREREEQILARLRRPAETPSSITATAVDGVGLEEVGRHAGAIADVVAHVVCDHGRVARVVLRYARFDLADEVGADVGGLGEDAAAEPGEDGDRASRRTRARSGHGSPTPACGSASR